METGLGCVGSRWDAGVENFEKRDFSYKTSTILIPPSILKFLSNTSKRRQSIARHRKIPSHITLNNMPPSLIILLVNFQSFHFLQLRILLSSLLVRHPHFRHI